MILTERPLSQE